MRMRHVFDNGQGGRQMAKQKERRESKENIRPDADVELRREMARTGDVGGILNLLATMRCDIDRAGEILRELGTAIGVRAQQDPEDFSREVFARMVAMSAHLMFRA